MITDTVIEIISPLAHRDTTYICRISRIPGLVVTCSGCGQTAYHDIHLPMVAHGIFCSQCCPCLHFVPTPEEEQAIERNRRNVDADAREVAREFRRQKAERSRQLVYERVANRTARQIVITDMVCAGCGQTVPARAGAGACRH